MIEIDYLKVGQHLKKLRSELGITQDQVAKDLGCTVASSAMWNITARR